MVQDVSGRFSRLYRAVIRRVSVRELLVMKMIPLALVIGLQIEQVVSQS